MRHAPVVLLIVLTGCVKSDLPTAPMSGGLVQVQGRVVDFVTKAGVANAPVFFGSYGARTDSFGFYRLNVPSGDYDVTAAQENIGTLHAVDPEYRGDVFVRGGNCTAAYGLIVNKWSRRPVPSANVSFVGGEARSDSTGWYVLDLGCNRDFGIGTTFMRVTAAGYADATPFGGRREGIRGIRRLDVALAPQ